MEITREQRFWAGFKRRNGCLIWQRSLTPNGYGQSWWTDVRRWLVHRLAWTLQHGPIPDAAFVLHRCDVRPCGDTDHLYLGTQQDNARDRIAAGSYGRMPRLRLEDRERIKTLHELERYSPEFLAEVFLASPKQIMAVLAQP